MSSFLLGAAVGAGFGGGLAFFIMQQQQQKQQQSGRAAPLAAGAAVVGASAAEVAAHPAAAVGLPSHSEIIRPFTGFIACFDSRTRNPRWVVERVTRESLRPGDGVTREGEREPFAEDAEIDPRFRSRLDDFRGSGYDRGHLAPAANHKGSRRELQETFLLANISPQVGADFNRHYWARLEKFTRDLAKKYDDVFIVTGPLFLPQPAQQGGKGAADAGGAQGGRGGAGPRKGGAEWKVEYSALGKPPALVAVPTHFFKVVFAENGGGGGASSSSSPAVGCFVLPNAPIPPGEPLTRFAVPLEWLEQVAGLSLFPARLPAGGATRERLRQAEQEWLVRIGGAERANPPMQLLLPPPRPQPLLLTAGGDGGGAGAGAGAEAGADAAAGGGGGRAGAPGGAAAAEGGGSSAASAEALSTASRPRGGGGPTPLCEARRCAAPALILAAAQPPLLNRSDPSLLPLAPRQVHRCELPSENWWEAKKKAAAAAAAPAAASGAGGASSSPAEAGPLSGEGKKKKAASSEGGSNSGASRG